MTSQALSQGYSTLVEQFLKEGRTTKGIPWKNSFEELVQIASYHKKKHSYSVIY